MPGGAIDAGKEPGNDPTGDGRDGCRGTGATSSRRPARTEGGFTLAEVVLTMAILGVITAALAAVIIAVFRNDGGAATSVTDARDAQLVATYFTRDVESATSVDTSPGRMACLQDPDNGQQKLVEITRPDVTVDYYWTPAAGVSVLYRQSCGRRHGSSNGAPLARTLSSNDPPTVSCTPAAQCLGSGSSVTLSLQMANESEPYSVTANPRAALSSPSTTSGGRD